MPHDESKGSQLDAIGSLAQRQLDNTCRMLPINGRQIGNVGLRSTVVLVGRDDVNYPNHNVAHGSHDLTIPTCPNCGSEANESLRICPSCGHDWGSPNVRRAEGEAGALRKRYDEARRAARSVGTLSEFDALSAALSASSHVVVAMPLLAARTLLTDPRSLYSNYELLVGGEVRTPAPFASDADRHSTGGELFGSYAADIRYGVLSLDGRGLSSYGIAFLKLRDVSVRDRTTFLEENSFRFVERGGHGRHSLPKGRSSVWRNRNELASTKLQPTLEVGSDIKDWAAELVRDGEDRLEDAFVEAHIFGPFNAASVESVSFGSADSRSERNDIASIEELMARRDAEKDSQ